MVKPYKELPVWQKYKPYKYVVREGTGKWISGPLVFSEEYNQYVPQGYDGSEPVKVRWVNAKLPRMPLENESMYAYYNRPVRRFGQYYYKTKFDKVESNKYKYLQKPFRYNARLNSDNAKRINRTNYYKHGMDIQMLAHELRAKHLKKKALDLKYKLIGAWRNYKRDNDLKWGELYERFFN